MGAISPVESRAMRRWRASWTPFHRPILAELARRGAPFRGVLFAGLMLTADGPRLLECNVRFGDPETQALTAPTGHAAPADCWPAVAHGRLAAAAADAGHHRAAACRSTMAPSSPWSSRPPATRTRRGRATPSRVSTARVPQGRSCSAPGWRLRNQGSLHRGRAGAGGRGARGTTSADAIDRAYAAVDSVRIPGSQVRQLRRADIGLLQRCPPVPPGGRS